MANIFYAVWSLGLGLSAWHQIVHIKSLKLLSYLVDEPALSLHSCGWVCIPSPSGRTKSTHLYATHHIRHMCFFCRVCDHHTRLSVFLDSFRTTWGEGLSVVQVEVWFRSSLLALTARFHFEIHLLAFMPGETLQAERVTYLLTQFGMKRSLRVPHLHLLQSRPSLHASILSIRWSWQAFPPTRDTTVLLPMKHYVFS